MKNLQSQYAMEILMFFILLGDVGDVVEVGCLKFVLMNKSFSNEKSFYKRKSISLRFFCKFRANVQAFLKT